jgi:hypothetical protein
LCGCFTNDFSPEDWKAAYTSVMLVCIHTKSSYCCEDPDNLFYDCFDSAALIVWCESQFDTYLAKDLKNTLQKNVPIQKVYNTLSVLASVPSDGRKIFYVLIHPHVLSP